MQKSFEEAAHDEGLILVNPIADGNIHRCGTVEHPRSKNGAYILYPNAGYGGFQNWETGGEWVRWREGFDQLGRVPRREFQRPTQSERNEKGDSKRLASLAASRMWSSGLNGPHPYLTAKGICSVGTRVLDDRLLVPMRTIEGKLSSLQFILPNGKKWFMKYGEVKGRVCVLKETSIAPSEFTFLCEGYATAATVYAATRCQRTVACFSCNGLVEVARLIKASGSKRKFIICADNDHRTKGNPGVTKANEAAEEIGAKVVYPDGINGTDFNDMMIERGIFFVEDYIKCRL